jgi:hypothetical protein
MARDLALIHTEGLDEEIRCTMCINCMKSDRGCDGNCVVDKDMYKKVMDVIEKRIQPTTKENLAVAELGEDLRKTRTAICNKKVLIGFNLAVAVMNKHLGGKK